MNNNTLIISMTSYPARINGVASVWESILNQNVDKNEYHCVLVLAEPEFPDKVLPKDLQAIIDRGDVELIWYPVNIRSHKKLMPTLKKYPNSPILVVDDDITRKEGWLRVFIDDHKKYPNDIITGTFQYFLDGDYKFQRMTDFKQKNAGGKNQVPGIIMNFARPANGCAGTLYPAGTFTDKRFFDEKKMMEMSPTSDESWQYAFNIMADKVMRQTSVIFDESETVVPGSQAVPTSLYKVNKLKYQTIFNDFAKEFPQFKEKILERQNRYYFSLTSYPARYKRLPEVITSLLEQTIKPEKILLTLTKEEENKLTPELKKFIDNGVIEIVCADEDLKPHKKYYYAMKKYPAEAIITVDDDIVYAKTMAESLLRGYHSHPNCVIARRVHKIRKDGNGKILPYKQWLYECQTVLTPSFELLATGGAGTLYPPNILGIDGITPENIKEVLLADDIFLKHIEMSRGIKVLFVKDVKDEYMKDEETQKLALYKSNCSGGGNDKYIKELAKGTKLTAEGSNNTKKEVVLKKYNPKIIHHKRILGIGKPASKSWKNFFND